MHLQSYHNSTIPFKREHNDYVHEVKKASFTPLVFVTTKGMGREATIFIVNLLTHYPAGAI